MKFFRGKSLMKCTASILKQLVFYAQSTNTVIMGQTVFCNQTKMHKVCQQQQKRLFNEYKISSIFSENAVFKLQTDPWLLIRITILLSVGLSFPTCVYKLIIPFEDGPDDIFQTCVYKFLWSASMVLPCDINTGGSEKRFSVWKNCFCFERMVIFFVHLVFVFLYLVKWIFVCSFINIFGEKTISCKMCENRFNSVNCMRKHNDFYCCICCHW